MANVPILDANVPRSTTSAATVHTNYGNMNRYFMPDNYLYLYHVPSTSGMGTCLILPAYADSVTDTQSVTFTQSTPLARSAPIYSYNNSGPRTVQVMFNLHRELMKQINYKKSNAIVPAGDDYVDILIRCLQASVLPSYDVASKMVNPPVVGLKLGTDIFIKGVITGAISLTYKYPILDDGRYALVDVGFSVSEIERYDAISITSIGSRRGAISAVTDVWIANTSLLRVSSQSTQLPLTTESADEPMGHGGGGRSGGGAGRR